MIEQKNFKVGDRVVNNYHNGGCKKIGTIIKITEKRGDVVVDYGYFQERYDRTGWEKSDNYFYRSHITLLTPEIEEELRKEEVINECKQEMEHTEITYEMAVKILEVFEDEEHRKIKEGDTV